MTAMSERWAYLTFGFVLAASLAMCGFGAGSDLEHERYCRYALAHTTTATDSIRFAADSGCVAFLTREGR